MKQTGKFSHRLSRWPQVALLLVVHSQSAVIANEFKWMNVARAQRQSAISGTLLLMFSSCRPRIKLRVQLARLVIIVAVVVVVVIGQKCCHLILSPKVARAEFRDLRALKFSLHYTS